MLFEDEEEHMEEENEQDPTAGTLSHHIGMLCPQLWRVVFMVRESIL